jgi:hypothetical protein
VNDIIRSTFFELANHHQKDLMRDAERSRLIAQALRGPSPRIIRFVRLNLGNLVIGMGRRIEGCSAKVKTEEVNATPALMMAR